MPYSRKGKTVYSKGKVKQKAKSVKNAKKAIRLLNAIDHGFVPRKNKKRNKA